MAGHARRNQATRGLTNKHEAQKKETVRKTNTKTERNKDKNRTEQNKDKIKRKQKQKQKQNKSNQSRVCASGLRE